MPPDPEHDPDASRELFDDALIRTHLANERTFLAWLRTAVVLLGVGLGAIALGGSGRFEEAVALALGGVSLAAALVMVVWAYVSFGATTAGIERRRYRPGRSRPARRRAARRPCAARRGTSARSRGGCG